ncbi:fructosamine kinase family protein [Halorhabdus rudnickae]|uniref:fructosamine kinase family protein n=1 Tax=Halorhabdus rudnickae TaxID=1775544 RepID=UPI001FCE4720|nr:fructosamine kinase family protein [Halorhabdus rudnickae]
MHPIARKVGDTLAVEPTACRELDGGMIGQVHRVDLADGTSVVAKTGETPLSVEASMLRYLGTHTDLAVPAVLSASDDLLVIEYVDGDSTITPAVERDAADQLAALHDHSAEAFGFPFQTLCGPLAQPNPWTDDWIDFFREHRLCRQARGAREEGPLDRERFERIQKVADDLSDLLVEPDEPALIHGDVWRTNVLAANGDVRAFLDPAIYYAHPEVELAYVDWTDTFGDPFFERYRSRHSIEPGFFEHRRFVYRLYPLLIHVRLFGSEYLPGIDATLTELGY